MKKKNFPEILSLLLISAIVYLPHIGSLTYYKDDWYYIYDGMLGGAKIFHEMFRIDRPARGFFFEWYYTLFGPNPLPWHLSVFVWRALAALGALWIFNLLWKENRKFNFIAALLFAIYPGYFWWISAIEYQPMIASLALQVFSIAFTLKVVQSAKIAEKATYGIGSILTGWSYIALVDYAIGMEAFRFIAVYLLIAHDINDTFWKRLLAALKAWAWTVLIPFGIVVWRIFFFTNERKATDIGGQLSVFFSNPVSVGIDWLLQIYNSVLNLSVQAWINQFPTFIQSMRLRDITLSIVLAVIVTLLVVFAEKQIKQSAETKDEGGKQAKVTNEALILGGLGMILGVLPVVMANRYVNISGFSHYGLPASLAAAVFMAGIIEIIALSSVRKAVLYGVIVFASLSHFGIATNAAMEEKALQEFWWQVSWRVPDIQPGTTLVIYYPLPGMGDGGAALMEAANVIYFPEFTGDAIVHYPLSGLTLNSENLPGILDGTQIVESGYRSHTYTFDYTNILVMSQPTLNSCVHVMNASAPLISEYDPVDVSLVASQSKIENVIVDAEPVSPPEYIYGKEPDTGWCSYFQAADLAAQTGDWERVAALGDEAIALSFAPEDRVEWLPFLKAYAIRGDAETLKQLSKRVIGEKIIRLQACEMLSSIEQPLNDDVREMIDVNYCKGSE
ncbi:MAG TPA: hypothetical protein PLT08_08790 [Anaerolineales bacterium]|nr:hypothetical protein [Anaerolineales bacterium]